MFSFSKAGIKNEEVFCLAYSEFMNWCKQYALGGTFSTYCDGEPVFFCAGLELSYRTYLAETTNVPIKRIKK